MYITGNTVGGVEAGRQGRKLHVARQFFHAGLFAMMLWREIFHFRARSAGTAAPIEQIAQVAYNSGYPMFAFEGIVYLFVTPGEKAAPGCEHLYFDKTDFTVEMLKQPEIFAIVDPATKRMAMNPAGEPLLFTNPAIALAAASKLTGVPEFFWRALYEQREARKNAPALVVPEEKKIILPG